MDIEVEQVATYILSRFQETVDVDIIALRIWREGLRQHRHLDVMCYLQLVLDSGL